MTDQASAPKPRPPRKPLTPTPTHLPAQTRADLLPADGSATPAAGPLGKLIEVSRAGRLRVKDPTSELGVLPSANALIMMRQLALTDGHARIRPEDAAALHEWATTTSLGMKSTASLLQAVSARRTAALGKARGCHRQLQASPQWRVIVGIGERANPHEIGITLHGTYGWPIIPGSSLKGMTAAWARTSGGDPDIYQQIFGHPVYHRIPTDIDEHQGSVTFLDALPTGPVTITLDVVNPHGRNEWTNPIPSYFLTISAGQFDINLTSASEPDCNQALEWCREALDELGVGAKTGAGYGFMLTKDPI